MRIAVTKGSNYSENNTMQPIISFIVPMWCVEKYIEECIQSIINQTRTDFELILIDDGSTDSTLNICNQYQSDCIHVISQEHKGTSIARANGLSYAKGRYVAFVDGDDWIEPVFAEIMVETAEREDADIVVCSYTSFYEKNETKHRLPNQPEDYLSLCQAYMENKASVGTFCFKLFRRDILLESRQLWESQLSMGEDLLFAWHSVHASKKIISIPEAFLYHYRIHSDSTTHQYQQNLFTNHQQLYRSLCLLKWEDALHERWNHYLRSLKKSLVYAVLINEAKHSVSMGEMSILVKKLQKWSNEKFTLKDCINHVGFCNYMVSHRQTQLAFLYIKFYRIYRLIRKG